MYWEFIAVLYLVHHILFCVTYELIPKHWWKTYKRYKWGHQAEEDHGVGDITLTHFLWSICSMPGLLLQVGVSLYPEDNNVLLRNFDTLFLGSFLFSLSFWVHYRRHFTKSFLSFMFVHHSAGITCVTIWRVLMETNSVVVYPWGARGALFWHGSALITTEWFYIYRFFHPGKSMASFKASMFTFLSQRVWRVSVYAWLYVTAHRELRTQKGWNGLYMGAVSAFFMDVLDIFAQGRSNWRLYKALNTKHHQSPKKKLRTGSFITNTSNDTSHSDPEDPHLDVVDDELDNVECLRRPSLYAFAGHYTHGDGAHSLESLQMSHAGSATTLCSAASSLDSICLSAQDECCASSTTTTTTTVLPQQHKPGVNITCTSP